MDKTIAPLIRLRASSRALLSTLFQDPNPATSQVETLESDLIKIETCLGRLKAAVLTTWHEPLDWGGFLDDLQLALEELPKAIDNVGEWGVGCIEQFGRHVPVYSLLLDAALAALRTNDNSPEPPTLAPSAGGTPFGSLGQAIEAFQNGATIAAPGPTKQLITRSDISCPETQSDDGLLIWSQLRLDSRRVRRGGLTLVKRLPLVASWICAGRYTREHTQNASSLRDATFDIDSVEKLEAVNSQAFLDVLKAAAILREKDGCLADTPSNLTLLIARNLELDILREINAFYQDVFDAPNYWRISECSFDLSRSSLGHLKEEGSPRLAQSPVLPRPLFSSPTSNQTRHSMFSGSRLDGSYGSSAETSSPDPSEPQTQSRQKRSSTTSPVVGALPETVRPTHGRISSPSTSHNDDMVRGWGNDGLEVVSGDDSGLELAAPIMPFHPDMVGVEQGLMVARIEHMNEQRGRLMVTAIENEHVCTRVDQLSKSGDEYEELFNESIQDNQPVQFYHDIECIPRKKRGRDVHIPCRVRLFKGTTTRDRMLHVYTELEGQSSKELDHQRYLPNAQFVPKYAFDGENEFPQAYIRCHESKMTNIYKFLPHERDESRTYLQGFQGAVLGLLFQGGYRLESISRPRGLRTKDETMKEPIIQFWTDQRPHPKTHSPSPGSSPGFSSPDIFTGRKARDLTHDDLDKFKNTLPCPRMFIYSKSPKPAIYMMFVDDRVELKHPTPLFKIQAGGGSEARTVQMAACRNVSERFRIREIDSGVRPGIPLDLEGLHRRDQDADGFQDVKSLSLVFPTESACKQFVGNFSRLQTVWDRELVPYRQLRDRFKNPRVAIVVRPKSREGDT